MTADRTRETGRERERGRDRQTDRERERERDRVGELRNKNTTKGSDFFRAYTRPGK